MYYGIEKIRVRRNKKKIIFIIIITILVIALSILLGTKASKSINYNKAKNDNNNSTNNTIIEEKQENKDIFTKKQLDIIDNIYNSKQKRVFLTFDDGPSSSITPKILEILKKENVKATFFVLGTMVKSNPEILRKEYEQGHYIANHGYSHIYKNIYKNRNKILEEYNRTENEIKKALNNTKYESHLFRFPGGSVGGPYDDIKKQAIKELEKNNIAYLDWNALTGDADGAETKSEILNNLKETSEGKNSIVILMHDAPNKDLTYKTLPDVIKYFRNNGYAFKNIYDII